MKITIIIIIKHALMNLVKESNVFFCFSRFLHRYIYIYRKVRLMKPTHDPKLGVTVNHVLVSLASPFYDLALHLCVLSTI